MPGLFFARSESLLKILQGIVSLIWITVKSRGIKPKQLIYKEFQIFREWAKSEVYIEKLENSAIDQKQPPINSFAQVLAIQVFYLNLMPFDYTLVPNETL